MLNNLYSFALLVDVNLLSNYVFDEVSFVEIRPPTEETVNRETLIVLSFISLAYGINL